MCGDPGTYYVHVGTGNERSDDLGATRDVNVFSVLLQLSGHRNCITSTPSAYPVHVYLTLSLYSQTRHTLSTNTKLVGSSTSAPLLLSLLTLLPRATFDPELKLIYRRFYTIGTYRHRRAGLAWFIISIYHHPLYKIVIINTSVDLLLVCQNEMKMKKKKKNTS